MDGLNFREYQRLAAATDQQRGDDLKSIMVPLLGLAGEAGSLLTEYKKWLRDGAQYKPFTDQVSEEIGDILWYLANIAQKCGLDLEEVAQENLAKLADRWGDAGKGATSLFHGQDRYDTAFPPGEQLPLRFRVDFREVLVEGRRKLEATYNGRQFGNHLTDNSHDTDGYRFHDVFHLTFATLLGWSPIARSAFGVKRRSNPAIDEVEDGGRAKVTEEAVSAIVFSYAKDYSFFDGVDAIPYELLRTIRLMTRPFEVRDRSMREWEQAILKAYAIWRAVNAAGGGAFVGDAVARTIEYVPMPSERT